MTSAANRADGVVFLLCLNDRGGAEFSMLRLARGMAEAGQSVSLAVYGQHTEIAREQGFNGEIVDLHALRTFGAVLSFWRLVWARNFTTIISALTHTNLAAVAAASLSRKTLRVIVTEHGLDGIAACRSSRVFAALTKLLYRKAFAVVAVSQGLAEQWRALLPKSATVATIYNPIVDDDASSVPTPAHPWLSDAAVPVVMGIGRFKEEKNFALLLRAFARVVAQRPARLILLGEGEQRATLEALALELNLSDKVLMPGFVADIRAWLAPASLLVCPSRREGFGNILVEALSLGVPVVACDCPYGPAEILGQGRYGRLVPVDDVDALAVAITQTLDGVGVDRASGLARAQDFTVKRCIDAYRALVDNPPTH